MVNATIKAEPRSGLGLNELLGVFFRVWVRNANRIYELVKARSNGFGGFNPANRINHDDLTGNASADVDCDSFQSAITAKKYESWKELDKERLRECGSYLFRCVETKPKGFKRQLSLSTI